MKDKKRIPGDQILDIRATSMKMNKRIVRDILRLAESLFFIWLYIPHLLVFTMIGGKRKVIMSDLLSISHQINIQIPSFLQLLYQLHNNAISERSFTIE